ncbi:hypothetical protein, partial [Microbulbifer sp.]|uniref:hypothetical protein n=1 Tax=Microbulbifer sp. TaxID=1908541 RepID=UPI003F40B604
MISTGHVMARAQVLGPNGGPILVKVRMDGNSSEEVEEIGEAYAGGPLDGVYILSATEYRRALQDLAELKATQP